MVSDEKVAEEKAPKIIFTEFDGWIVESGELFDTTNADLAKENKIFDEKSTYGPLPLLVGRGRLFAGLEKSLSYAEIDKEYEITIPPEDAAGPRDPKLVELFPIREFLKQDIVPEVGLQVTVKNKVGHISAVTAGRVRVDFNNKLAGKTLKYKYKITSEPKDTKEKFEAIMKMDYGSHEGFSIELEENKIAIKLPDVCKYDQKWILSKYRIVTDLRDVLGTDIIQFIEEYTRTEKKEEVPTEETHNHDHNHEHNHEHDHDRDYKNETDENKEAKKDRPVEELIE